MADDRVLIEIDTVAQMAGISEANAGFGSLIGTVTAVGVGLLGLGKITQSAISIADEHAKAQNNLAQASAATKGNLQAQELFLKNFMQTNRDYISNQADVINSYAQLIRSGLDQAEVQRVMNDALDLAALKGISYTDAVTALGNAEFGRMRGLIDLGITTTKYTDANGNLIKSQHSVAQAMGEVDAKVKGGRGSFTDLTKASNDLGNAWQDLANKYGPALEEELAKIVKFGADHVVPGIQVIIDQVGAALPIAIQNIKHELEGAPGAQDNLAQYRATMAKYDKTGIYDPYASIPQWDPQYKAPTPTKLGTPDSTAPSATTSYDAARKAAAALAAAGESGIGPVRSTVGSSLTPDGVQTVAEQQKTNAQLQAMNRNLQVIQEKLGAPRTVVYSTVNSYQQTDYQLSAMIARNLRKIGVV